MLSCIFFLLSLSFASASDLKPDGLTFTPYNLLSSYYWFRHSKPIEGRELSLPLTKYCNFVKDFFSKSPKDCLTIVRDARDDSFSSFFLTIILSAPNRFSIGIINYFCIIGEYESPRAEMLEGLSYQFEFDCNKVAKDLWSIPFVKNNQNAYLERVETFEILLCIMKQFASAMQEGLSKQTLHKSYKILKFVLRNFMVNADYLPSYEGYLITFNTLRTLSRKHRGLWPNDSTTAENLIKLFRYYSHQFSYNHFNELTTVPSLLLLLMLSEEGYRRNGDLFPYFSKNAPDLKVSFANLHSVICTRN